MIAYLIFALMWGLLFYFVLWPERERFSWYARPIMSERIVDTLLHAVIWPLSLIGILIVLWDEGDYL